MTTYLYKAKKNTAETVTGEINAQSQDEAIELINQLGLLPVSIVEQATDEGLDKVNFRAKIPSKERYVFTRQMANLIKSGVSVIRAIDIIAQQTQRKEFKRVLHHLSYQIKNGTSLSDAMSVYPLIFSSLYLTMVRAGEESGNLRAMLESVAGYQHRQEETRSKVRMAVTYPVLMLFVGIATVYFMLTFVLPKMSSLFQTIGDNMPLPTKILLQLSAFLSQWGLGVILAAGLIVLFILRWAKSSPGKKALSYFVLNIPIIGEILLHAELARFCRTLVLLNEGGVSLVNALQAAIPILENELVKNQLIVCRESLIAGGSFGETLKKSNKIPSMMGYLIAVGEESGNLDEVLSELAQTFENETSEKIKIMTTLLEPVMILTIGLVIGFIVFAMLLPIFQLDIMSQ